MRYIIHGAGAIGGTIGGLLAAAGRETVLICRSDHLRAIQANGLLLRRPDGDRRIPVAAVGSPAELTFEPDDVVILTMKGHDSAAALDDLEAAGGHDVAVVCGQNGVANEPFAARRFTRVYAMLVQLPSTYLTPGEVISVTVPYAGVLDTGRYPSGTDEITQILTADLTSAGFLARPVEDAMRLKYAKLLRNIGNGVQVIAGTGPEATAVVEIAREEARAAYAAAGIDYCGPDEFRERVETVLQPAPVAGMSRSGSSTWQSMARGARRLEVDYLNGEIVLIGRQAGTPTPYNAAIRQLSQAMAWAGEPAESRPASDIHDLAARIAKA